MHSSKWNINFYSEIENWNKSQESVRNWQFFHFAISDVTWSAWNMKRNSINMSIVNKQQQSQKVNKKRTFKKDVFLLLTIFYNLLIILGNGSYILFLRLWKVRCRFEVVQCSNMLLQQIHSWTNNDKSDLGPHN